MKNKNFEFLKTQIVELHKIVNNLHQKFPIKPFTLDGRLVGDIGEVIASIFYDVDLHKGLKKYYDGETSDGRNVQIKVTFKDSLTFNHKPDYYLGLKFKEDGTFEEIFNGRGEVISDFYSHRKGIGENLLSFPINQLIELQKKVQEKDKIPKR
jgi:hypothetical protein